MPTDYSELNSLIQKKAIGFAENQNHMLDAMRYYLHNYLLNKTKTMPQQNTEEIIALEAVLPMIERSPSSAKKMIELVVELLKNPVKQDQQKPIDCVWVLVSSIPEVLSIEFCLVSFTEPTEKDLSYTGDGQIFRDENDLPALKKQNGRKFYFIKCSNFKPVE